MPEATSRLPYPGLRAFRREEGDLFFGREDCINGMVDRLAATRFLAVLGSSGTGKSSVVKTGMLDGLDLGLMAAAGSAWRVVEFKPGGAPLKNLALRLLQTRMEGTEAAKPITEADAALFRAFLLRGPLSVAEWCGDGHLPAGTNLLLLVDQFEELFRYQDYAGREEAEAFAALLLESARQSKATIYVTLTMRSEYLGACALIDGLAEAISAGMVLIPRMTREQCRSAIVGPAAVCGFKIAEDLTNRLLNDLAVFAPWDDRSTRDQLDRLARRADQLPLLQYCLNRMWTRARDDPPDAPIMLTLADYERIGGLSGALNAHADEVLRGLGEECRPVAEAVFRALTEGSLASDAVRRPTRFGELVAICGGDEARVRKVVDAFRAAGCNFLAPGLDPADPRPLMPDTIVDISHESLIRQWKQLSEWVEAEGRARRQWQRLRDRFDDKQPLQGPELATMEAWRREQQPSAAWARRYGGDFAALMKFMDDSEWRRRRFAPLVLPLVATAALSVCMVFAVGILLLVFHDSTAGQPTLVYVLCVSTAATCAFGLWRYVGFTPKGGVLAGTVILAVVTAVDAGFLSLIGAGRNNASFLLHTSVAAPAAVTAIMIFARRLRNVYVWVLLVGSYIVLLRIVDSITNSQGWLDLVIWCVWFSLLGFQLRQAGDSAVGTGDGPGLAAFRLALTAFFLVGITGSLSAVALLLAFKSVQPSWWWLINQGGVATVTAFTLGFGLQTYTALSGKQALLGGAVIFVALFASGIALLAALLSHKVPLVEADHWAGATLFAPCTLSALALFDRAFRRITLCLLFAVLFIAPYATFVWLADSGRIVITAQSRDFLILIIATLWIAAIGYWLRRTSLAERASKGENAQCDETPPEPRAIASTAA
jgi:conflict system STAND superfamily ATPase